jgi:hypothetical protein
MVEWCVNMTKKPMRHADLGKDPVPATDNSGQIAQMEISFPMPDGGITPRNTGEHAKRRGLLSLAAGACPTAWAQRVTTFSHTIVCRSPFMRIRRYEEMDRS